MGKLFGTDGVRGVANKELSAKLAYKMGYAAVLNFKKDTKRPKFVVGMDTRISCNMLYMGLSAGIMSAGGDVINAGIISTPAVAVLTREINADSGVVISASHNPFEYNGIKFFNSDGYKLSDEKEEEIERLIFENEKLNFDLIGKDVGTMKDFSHPRARYIEYLLEKINIDDLRGMKIVLDLANGATYKVAREVFERLSADVFVINDVPNGSNINDKCGSTDTKMLQEMVVRKKADLGIAFDGDGDRVIMVDNEGNEINGDLIMYACSVYLKEKNLLNKNTLVLTVMSNLGLKKALEKKNINISETKVGDRYVVERMLEEGYNIGGEQSGHIILSNINSTGDGIASALLMCKILKEKNMTIRELIKDVKIYPQVLINAVVDNEKKFDYKDNKEILEDIDKLEAKYAGNGRVLIRTSGTEPLVRVMIEGEDISQITDDAKELAMKIEEILG